MFGVPFLPSQKIEVDINKPGWQWEGHGYFDANFGSNALEKDFLIDLGKISD